MKRRSFTFLLFLRLLPVLALAAALPWLLAYWMNHGWWVTGISSVVLLSLMWWSLRRATAPVRSLMRALAGTTSSYRDGEFNFGVYWPGNDELGDLVDAHRELGDVLREQRQGLVQRELLLDTMVQNTPVAMLLIAAGGDGISRVVFSNLAARKLLHGGWKLEGQRMEEVLEQLPVELRDAIARGGDSLFAVRAEVEEGVEPDEDDEQVYHLSRRAFHLNGRPHDLLLVRQLTAELRRQEVQTWKKVIRVISHELNNSLAPIASLAHSGGELVKRERFDRLPEIFSTIEDRARHLEGFIRGYARFAKLPQPQLQTVHWAPFLSSLRQQIPFGMDREPDETLSSRIDIAQFGQALLNLLKNSHEACAEAEPPNDDVQVQLTRLPQWLRLDVLDRGKGMNEQVLQNALMPFYSTKRNGTGLGLALTREIVEAHGGRVSLQNRGDGGLCVSILLPVS
ncbi:ATP-binding protein [Stenotrophomonas sp. SAU14A_NAIMI4_5]|uniref:sensor histidine kinase n=1 Tax=Stenotrophomonas sp. SAU14A_NAIMI4_5 TaxID=2072413 RepID=UPI000D53F729|nr:ATP-binding protein [Stenotrophomonas sp. SAU14A_NAIMI4_5]AWH50914.1 ATP-binding protein [Stenotrophomonas sp. SAU14A_NAIMI4_5]